ncbi:hypothetical protein BO71DRAFT_435790 [Aspergillus ellipticus CBS 707.79]|uniref:Uncharacterized protein n=1 Tax=Aspergillus ellipticus CBS 707.79 TaxID=1448320 RepID=A0A319D1J1_9EURO|nr:hypothetical protein BO71DRAFT_435790 [Aspergillus ellipticus CBS 707.79]
MAVEPSRVVGTGGMATSLDLTGLAGEKKRRMGIGAVRPRRVAVDGEMEPLSLNRSDQRAPMICVCRSRVDKKNHRACQCRKTPWFRIATFRSIHPLAGGRRGGPARTSAGVAARPIGTRHCKILIFAPSSPDCFFSLLIGWGLTLESQSPINYSVSACALSDRPSSTSSSVDSQQSARSSGQDCGDPHPAGSFEFTMLGNVQRTELHVAGEGVTGLVTQCSLLRVRIDTRDICGKITVAQAG